MRVTSTIRYDAGPDEVYSMLTDPAFQDRKLKGTGALAWEVEVLPAGAGAAAGATVRTSRALPTANIPDLFRSAVGTTLRLVQVETWGGPDPDGGRSGTVTVEVQGAPIRFSGTLRLSPAAGGTQELVDGELKARIPLVGGRVEKAAAPALEAAIQAEERSGRAWLAGQR